jgi:hypothetical protein
MTESYDEVKAKSFSFGAVGDTFTGTMLGVTKTTSADKYGKYSNIYRIKMKEGAFFDSTKNEKTGKYKLDDKQTIITAGEEYSLFVNLDKDVLIGMLNGIKKGQKFKATFVESKPTTKGNDAKIIKVFAGKDAQGNPLMDETYAAVEANAAAEEAMKKM